MGLLSQFKSWIAGVDDPHEPIEAVHLNPADPPLDSFGQYLNYAAYDPTTHLFALKDTDNKPQGMGFVMELNPFLGADDDLVNKLSNLFGLLPANTPMQIQMFGSPDLRGYFDRYRALQQIRNEDDPVRPVFENLAEKRIAYWQQGTQNVLIPDTPIRLRRLRCIISVNFHDADPQNKASMTSITGLMPCFY